MSYVKLKYKNKTLNLKVIHSSLGKNAFRIDKISKINLLTYDKGLNNTAICKSSISYINGKKSQLMHEGYPIEFLLNNHDYIDICYLLLYKKLPHNDQKQIFINSIFKYYNKINTQYYKIIKIFKKDSHPMAMLSAFFAYLSDQCHIKNSLYNKLIKKQNYKELGIFIISQMPILIALCYRYTNNMKFNKPNKKLNYIDNFLYMMFGNTNNKDYIKNKKLYSYIMNKILILHADHEQNASTTSIRLSCSAGSNLFSSINTAINTLWGNLHGGANEKVIDMLNNIKNINDIEDYINKSKIKSNNIRIMGIGHRIYKSYDPRATFMKKMCMYITEKKK